MAPKKSEKKKPEEAAPTRRTRRQALGLPEPVWNERHPHDRKKDK